jgi:hypothetical protein
MRGIARVAAQPIQGQTVDRPTDFFTAAVANAGSKNVLEKVLDKKQSKKVQNLKNSKLAFLIITFSVHFFIPFQRI